MNKQRQFVDSEMRNLVGCKAQVDKSNTEEVSSFALMPDTL